MGQLSDRRCGTGRRRADRETPVVLRGLLHDIGRDLAALSYLVELIRGDAGLGEATRRHVELIAYEIDRITELVQEKSTKGPEPEAIQVRPMLEKIVSLVATPNGTQVRLLPGEDLLMQIDGASLWRMVTNLLENAVRAAGRHGNVTVLASGGPDVLIEVIDDGPGFGNAPSGSASLGLGIVTGLAKACGGSLLVQPAEPLGTRAQLFFPGSGMIAMTPLNARGEQ